LASHGHLQKVYLNLKYWLEEVIVVTVARDFCCC